MNPSSALVRPPGDAFQRGDLDRIGHPISRSDRLSLPSADPDSATHPDQATHDGRMPQRSSPGARTQSRSGRAAIADLRTDAVRCYDADDPQEQRPHGNCPDLAARIAEHRRSAVPLGTLAPQAIDPRLIEKMRALGYLQ